MADILQQHFLRAQHRMKTQADKKRSERHLEVDDLVYLKLQPYIQSSVATRSNHKLSFKFFGPYRVVQRIGPVAYKLELPSSSRIHPVVHVSKLKKHVPPATQIMTELHSIKFTDVPVQVLDHAWVRRGGATRRMIKVRWSNQGAAMDTWETEAHVRQCFPRATAWGQAAS